MEDEERVLGYADLKELGIGFSDRWLRELGKTGGFPKSIHLSQNRVGWLRSEVMRWITARAAERDQPIAASQTGQEAPPRQQAPQRKGKAPSEPGAASGGSGIARRPLKPATHRRALGMKGGSQ